MRTLRRWMHNEHGFSLTELLVVIVIIGILASLAIPKFLGVITKAKATEAKLVLKHVYQLQQTYYMENDVYANTLDQLGFEQDKLKTEGGAARYKIEMAEVTPATFLIRAVAVVDYDKDGTFNVWSINQNNDIVEETRD